MDLVGNVTVISRDNRRAYFQTHAKQVQAEGWLNSMGYKTSCYKLQQGFVILWRD